MTEELLQYAWKHQLFYKDNMVTEQGESFEILHQGTLNTDAGPDFFNASIKIGGTIWAGNVEVHLKSSDWFKHKHHTDSAYKNVVVHVVLHNDTEIKIDGTRLLPTFIPKIDQQVVDNFSYLLAQKNWPACCDRLSKVDLIFRCSTINSMLVERLQLKTKVINKLLDLNNYNWSETFYQYLAICFGLKTNELPFEILSRSLPLKIVSKHKDNLFQLEALLFGQSGLLNEQLIGDDYFLKLREEYQYLSAKYQLKGMEGHLWKFLRLRPANFPTIRIAQFAALINKSDALFSRLMEIDSLDIIKNHFNLKASEYWDTHYKFNHPAKKQEKWLGDNTLNLLLVNCVVPFLFLYGDHNGKDELKERAFNFLEHLPAEKNHIIDRWTELKFETKCAYETQALLHLKQHYCDKRNCLNCQIGHKLMQV